MNKTLIYAASIGPAISGAIMGTVTGVCVAVLARDERQAAMWALLAAWVVLLLTYGLLADVVQHIHAAPEPEPEPLPAAPEGWRAWANDNPVLIRTQSDGRAGWAFDVTPEQWRALAARVRRGQMGLPVNQLSYHSKPFTEGEIKRFRDAAIEAGMATKTPTGRVYLNRRGRETVMLQAHSPNAG